MRFGRQEIAGDLFEHEAVERHVRVHGVDDPVAVTPRFAEEEVFVQAVGIGVARQIEPMPAPAFPELRRVQQPVHDALERVGPLIFKKRSHLLRSRRQAGQLKIERGESALAASASAAGCKPAARSRANKKSSIQDLDQSFSTPTGSALCLAAAETPSDSCQQRDRKGQWHRLRRRGHDHAGTGESNHDSICESRTHEWFLRVRPTVGRRAKRARGESLEVPATAHRAERMGTSKFTLSSAKNRISSHRRAVLALVRVSFSSARQDEADPFKSFSLIQEIVP